MRQTNIYLVALGCLFSGLAIGCSSSSDDPTPSPIETKEREDIVLTKTEEALVTSTNTFAFQALTQIGLEDSDALFSPLSVSMLMGVLQNGAAGETQSQIINTLGFNGYSAAEVNAYYRKMLTAAVDLDPQVQLSIANALYIQTGFPVYPAFIQTAEEMYDSEIGELDYSKDPVSMINNWCSDHTNGRIPKIIDELSADYVAILLNAIYFKATWTKEFDRKDTHKTTFTTGEGKSIKVDMMHMNEYFKYFQNENISGIELPYGNEAFSMVIMLPKQGQSPQEVLSHLDAETWSTMYQNGYERDISLYMPKFETKSDMDLIPMMKALGMTDAFDAGKADFSNLSERSTFLSLLKQKTYMKLDESGTEAAAVTIGAMELTSAGPTLNFVVDRPFLYMIKEKSTGCIYFIGMKNTI